ncbi:DUF3606 domain-containing protein [Caulobacter segnis]
MSISGHGAQSDRRRIHLRKDFEIQYWTGVFGVTEAILREAINRVGPSAEKVREQLSRASRAGRSEAR